MEYVIHYTKTGIIRFIQENQFINAFFVINESKNIRLLIQKNNNDPKNRYRFMVLFEKKPVFEKKGANYIDILNELHNYLIKNKLIDEIKMREIELKNGFLEEKKNNKYNLDNESFNKNTNVIRENKKVIENKPDSKIENLNILKTLPFGCLNCDEEEMLKNKNLNPNYEEDEFKRELDIMENQFKNNNSILYEIVLFYLSDNKIYLMDDNGNIYGGFKNNLENWKKVLVSYFSFIPIIQKSTNILNFRLVFDIGDGKGFLMYLNKYINQKIGEHNYLMNDNERLNKIYLKEYLDNEFKIKGIKNIFWIKIKK